MAFACNIDARGQAARLKVGIGSVFTGIVVGVLTLVGVLPPSLSWIPVAGMILGGTFTIWESRMGWCVLRAMGFKTKI